MTPALSKGLSQLSVTVAIPALLFSSMVPGASIELIDYAWPLLFLPAVYLLLGTLIGFLMLVIVQPPADFRLGIVAACAFGNTTGIPVILLSVLQQSLSHSVFADIGDPLLFLSLTLVTLPLMQWLIGLLLVALLKGTRDADTMDVDELAGFPGGTGAASRLGSPAGYGADGGDGGDGGGGLFPGASSEMALLREAAEAPNRPIQRHACGEESTSYISMMSQGEDEISAPYEAMGLKPTHAQASLLYSSIGGSMADRLYSMVPGQTTRKRVARGCWRTAKSVLRRLLVPQVVAIISGGLVGLHARQFVLPTETAPLGWLYLGISKLGAAAVPINLILLGAALSRTPARGQLPALTASAIVVARMIVMPVCGLGVARLLSALHLDVPYTVADPFWLVCLILTCTPTANNIVVMCDLAGENRRAMSASIFYQYCAAPLLLPGVLTLFIAFICRSRREVDL